ncbi:MAG: hypothetical protein K8S99_10905 [Planctomycetes bacterium]|nr:hypothetical protein [Planctomycetota bacterium]
MPLRRLNTPATLQHASPCVSRRAGARLISRAFLLALSLASPLNAQPATQPADTITPTTLRDLLVDTRLDAARRREAAISLLATGPIGVDLVARELNPTRDPETQLFIARAVILSDAAPPELAQPMLNLLADADPILLPELSAALSRYNDPRVLAALLAPAQNDKLPAEARSGPVFALGYHPRIEVARVLMECIQPNQPAPVRRAAFEALGNLTGIDSHGSDLAQWRRWWEQHRRLNEAQWLAEVLQNQTRRRLADERQAPRLAERLTELYRPLYRVTPAADRPVLLAAMLTDPLEPVRLLGVELTLQWLTDNPAQDNKPIHAGLRAALLSRLDDASPTVRQGAARLLREMRDESAADVVEQKLARGEETDPDVLKAYLQVMARMPRRGAVGAISAMLPDPILRNDAAGALTEAVTAGLVDPPEAAVMTRRLDELTRGPQPPEPRVIDLLGRLGHILDWNRVAMWMDAASQDVREASAKVWAQSGQPLTTLIGRASDPIIRRIFVDAAGRRGQSVEDFNALVDLRPADASQLTAWQRSVTAMASRVPAQAVIDADAKLQKADEDPATRDRILSAAIDAGAEQRSADDMAKLLLARGELRLSQGDANQALADLNAIKADDLVDPALRRRHRQTLFRTRLAAGEVDPAFSLAGQILGDNQVDEAGRNTVIEELLTAAQRQIATGQLDTARNILARLQTLLNGRPVTAFAARISELETKAGVAAPEPTPPAPTSAPGEPMTPKATPVTPTHSSDPATTPSATSPKPSPDEPRP